MIGLMQVAPFVLFYFYSQAVETGEADWERVFLMAGGAALFMFFVFLIKRIRMNPVLVGINLYLSIGALGYVAGIYQIAEVYDALRAAGMLAVITLTGLLLTFTSKYGFVGVDNVEGTSRAKIIGLSVVLVCIAAGATVVSYMFKGDVMLSEAVPFMMVLFAKHFFKTKIDGPVPPQV